jgi:hypothetical protein
MGEGIIDVDRSVHSLDGIGFIKALDAKQGPFRRIAQQDGASAHTSREALERFEESVDVIVD